MSEPAIGYEWHPIEDLPDGWGLLAGPELAALAAVWEEQRQQLVDARALEEFTARLRREWAIETGVIERLYDIDRGVTQVLIEQGISASYIPHGATDKPAESVVALIRDQEQAVEWLSDFVASRRGLSTSFIKGLHQLLTSHQPTAKGVDSLGRSVEIPLLRGQWKQFPNSPVRPDGSVHHYCPPEQVASEMDRLVAMHLRHQEEGIPPEVEAAWLHHRFTQIHPFQDGNGRVARSLATLVFLRAGWFPLVVRRSDLSYIGASEAADMANLKTLVDLFTSIEKRAFVRALSFSHQVVAEAAPVSAVIAAAADKLRERRQAAKADLSRVFGLADGLFAAATAQLEDVRRQLSEAMVGVADEFEANVATCGNDDEERRHWFRHQVSEAARLLDYFADMRTYHSWLRLRLREQSQTEVLVSFHGLGQTFSGVLACSVCGYRREETEDDLRPVVAGLEVACPEVFQFNYRDEESGLAERFGRWLHDSLAVALEQWRRGL